MKRNAASGLFTMPSILFQEFPVSAGICLDLLSFIIIFTLDLQSCSSILILVIFVDRSPGVV